jgi:hypothetical protein
LARDEARIRGWQSGFVSAGGRRKPSFKEFQTLAAAARKRQVTLVRAVRRKQVRELDELLRGVVGGKGGARDWLPFGPMAAGP